MQQQPVRTFTIGKATYELWEPVHILAGDYRGCLGQVITTTDQTPRKFVVTVVGLLKTTNLELSPKHIAHVSEESGK